jgi:hypothetical protein
MERLSEVLERVLLTQVPGRRDTFKIPEFDGSTDVSYFLRQFQDIMEANNWNRAAALLHLREALKGKAQDCGNADTTEGVFQALQARFGMSIREARNKLTLLKKENRTTLQEHAAEVSRLMNTAYQDLPPDHRHRLILDTFQSTLGNAYLQRHLLAVNAPTLEDCIRAGNEFLQIKTTNFPGPQVRIIEEGDEQTPMIQAVQNNPMEAMMKLLQQLTSEVSELKANQKVLPPRLEVNKSMDDIARNGMRNPGQIGQNNFNNKPDVCWNCGLSGHTKRFCRSRQWNGQRKTNPGNGSGPQQW